WGAVRLRRRGRPAQEGPAATPTGATTATDTAPTDTGGGGATTTGRPGGGRTQAPTRPGAPPRPDKGGQRPAGTRPAAPTRPPKAGRPAPSAPEAPPRPAPAGPTAPPAEVAEAQAEAAAAAVLVEPEVAEPEVAERPRLRDRLGKARSLFGGYLTTVRSRERIDESTWEALEEALILADVGADTALALLDELRTRVRAEKIVTPDELVTLLRDDLVERLQADRTLHIEPDVTNVWLFVGVNGVGKTTTIGKLGLQQRSVGRTVVMAAGDTFRAAAADQLATWAERVDVEVVRGNEGGDPGAVIFDAVQHAAAKKADLVLADTAGRLHNKVNLMEELKKVRRVAERPPGKVTEALLVLDATTGQNGLTQAKIFAEAVEVTGVVLTKLDGTAKGGIALAVQTELGIPVKLVGVGERAEDLVEFDPVEFVDALVAPEE
ncbi:MAG TPA: signal recognition particle-docking protein FtsY, partial [Acidimicrobiales bacterium]|nr:signal recognition particle-docking protein FtsY [Acidimicrobiales bacterium]